MANKNQAPAVSATDLAKELARLLRGEIDFRDFPWLPPEERRALGALGLSMLKAGKAETARAAFGVLIDLEPEEPVHYLMYAHAAALLEKTEEAFEHFGRSIALSIEEDRYRDVAAESFLGRGELLLRLGRLVEARADLADACSRIDDAARKKCIEAYLAS